MEGQRWIQFEDNQASIWGRFTENWMLVRIMRTHGFYQLNEELSVF
jgi:hypothetical protein